MTALAAWLYANVLGNLIASAIWAIPAAATFVWHHRRIAARIEALASHVYQHNNHHYDDQTGREGAYQHHLRRLAGHILDTPPPATSETLPDWERDLLERQQQAT